MGEGPHPGIFLFFLPAAAEPEADGRDPPHQGAADFPVSPQSSSEGPQGPDYFVPAAPQLFLPDRKNGLASMETLEHEFNGSFHHFFACQGSLLIFFRCPPALPRGPPGPPPGKGSDGILRRHPRPSPGAETAPGVLRATPRLPA